MAWTTPSTRVTGDLVTAAVWNAEIYYNQGYIYDELISTPATVSAPTRAIDGTVYQCGSDHWRLATISVNNTASGSGNRELIAYCDSTDPPTTIVARLGFNGHDYSDAGSWYFTMSFCVTQSFYYTISSTGVTKAYWYEWELH